MNHVKIQKILYESFVVIKTDGRNTSGNCEDD